MKTFIYFIIAVFLIGSAYFFLPKKNVIRIIPLISLPDVSMVNKEDNSQPLSVIPELEKADKKVILVSIDTLRAQSLGAYGYDRNTSENIDSFAKDKDATVFANAYTPIPETVPAHVAMFTGLYPNKSGYRTNANKKKETLPTIIKIFADNGYSTAGFYSSTIFSLNDNLDFGFQTFDPPITYNWSDRAEISAAETNDKVFKWLDSHFQDDFFLWVHYYEPHNPYTPFCTKDLYSKGLEPSNREYLDGAIKISDRRLWENITNNDDSYLLAKYDEEIYCYDKEFNRFIDKLKSLNIYKDATIIVVGDHGENFDHKSLFHGTNLYRSAVRVPFIIKSPLIKINDNQDNVSLVDIFPTLLSYFRLKNNVNLENLDGISLERLQRNKNRVLNMETPLPISLTDSLTTDKLTYAVLYKNFKFIRTTQGLELYKIDTDIKEENNLINKNTKQSEQVIKLNSLLKKYASSFNN